jgi:hypothetical protein
VPFYHPLDLAALQIRLAVAFSGTLDLS